MLVEPEDPAVVAPDSLEDPVSVQVPTVENRDLRLGGGNELAVNVDECFHPSQPLSSWPWYVTTNLCE